MVVVVVVAVVVVAVVVVAVVVVAVVEAVVASSVADGGKGATCAIVKLLMADAAVSLLLLAGPAPCGPNVSMCASTACATVKLLAVDAPTAPATSIARVWDSAPHPHAVGVRHPTLNSAEAFE